MTDLGETILGEAGVGPPPPMVSPPRLEGAPVFPQPGLYFGMPEEVYHSIYACSGSGLKDLSASPMIHWAKSALNPDKEESETDSKFKAMGRAYHCRICEGEEEFKRRYAVELDKADFADEDGKTDLCVTIDDIRMAIIEAHGNPKGTRKDALIAQLRELDPHRPIWDVEVEHHAKRHAGKEMISALLHKRIEIAAMMIAKDPQLKDAFTGGYAEVSLFWYDKRTGIPCKARIDYLKLNAFIDLKSFSNPMGKPIQRAIDAKISNDKHYLPVVFYTEGIEAVKEEVRSTKAGSVFGWLTIEGEEGYGTPFRMTSNLAPEPLDWAWQWAHQPQPDALYVYQLTGKAPVTRGREMRRGSTYEITSHAVQWLKRRWRRYAETYGTDPWLDIEPITATVDENLNSWTSTEFGESESEE